MWAATDILIGAPPPNGISIHAARVGSDVLTLKEGLKDEHFIAFIYELDNRREWTEERCWKKANPGLGTIKNRRTLKDKVEKAKKNPLLVKNLICKEFNIRETSSEAWLTFEQANNTEKFDLELLLARF